MGLFSDWFDSTSLPVARPNDSAVLLREKDGARAVAWPKLLSTVRSHYINEDTLRMICAELGYDDAAQHLQFYMPQDKKARSGDLGEILATEYTNEHISTRVYIKRLRFKDARETALRGDDILGAELDEHRGLHVLKGESKSRLALSLKVLVEAEDKLLSNGGRPSEHDTAFLAAHLLPLHRELGKTLALFNLRKVPARSLRHLLFAFTQSAPLRLFPTFASRKYPVGILRSLVAVVVKKHQKTIEQIYTDAVNVDMLAAEDTSQ